MILFYISNYILYIYIHITRIFTLVYMHTHIQMHRKTARTYIKVVIQPDGTFIKNFYFLLRLLCKFYAV